MSDSLVSLAAVLLSRGLLDSKDFEELKNEDISLENRIAKLTLLTEGRFSKGSQYRDVAEILEANKEKHGHSDTFKVLKKIIDSGQSSSSEYIVTLLKYFK